MSESQLSYLEDLISDMCESIYDWTKADTKLAKTILRYYGYDDVDIRFASPTFAGNRCLTINIWTGNPDCLYETIRFEY